MDFSPAKETVPKDQQAPEEEEAEEDDSFFGEGIRQSLCIVRLQQLTHTVNSLWRPSLVPRLGCVLPF